jgi:hypothetical protein
MLKSLISISYFGFLKFDNNLNLRKMAGKGKVFKSDGIVIDNK